MNSLEDGCMGVDLLKHNQEAFQEINKMLESGIKKIAIPRATGSGKTYLVGALAEKYNNEPKLVLEPTRPLLNSIKEKFDEFGITNTDFITYQKLIRMSNEDIAQMDYKLIFLDEAHHSVAPVWGKKINYLMETHSDSIIFGTSATTVRNDGVNVIDTIFEGNAVGELSLSSAIARKVLPCPHYITAIYRLDDEFEKLKKRIESSTNTQAEKKEFYEKMKEMRLHFEKSYGVPLILNKYIKVKDGKYLVFCKDKKHLDAMRDVVIDWFKTAGIKDIHSYAVYSDYPDKEKDYKEFQEDNSDSLKILFSINMLNEGLHIENISGVLMLRTTQSNTIYLQQLGRLVEADNLDKYLLVFDFVNNFSGVIDGIELLKEIKNAVAKEKENNPDFDDSGFEDIDTFFVMDQVLEIKEMFAEIEGRLEGSWDLYIKALKQYKEREGDCLVPARHIESINEMKVALGQWCQIMRQAKKENGNWKLTRERKTQLNQMGFVWNPLAYNFEINIKMLADYYKENGKYPTDNSENSYEKKLWIFLQRQKSIIRNSNYNLPEWKLKIIDKYLPDFSYETRSDQSFNKLIYYLKLYKKQYGHLNIKTNETIEGYNIGLKISGLNRG
jgi:superfamily II DNA or RNA helicase